MTQITNTTIFSLFSLLSSAIKSNSTLSTKFNDNNIYQYEPKHKGFKFKSFPYIWINIPDSSTSKVVYDNNFTLKDFSVRLILRVEWVAHSKVLDYCNALIRAIESYESTFESSGYYEVKIDLVDVNPNQQIEEKEIVESEFVISFKGQVLR